MADDGALVLQFSADTRALEAQLNRAVNALNSAAGKMEARAGHTERKLRESLDVGGGVANLERSLDKMFDSSRLAMIEQGSMRLRIFGSALEPLGGIGFAAAAGVVAFAGAMEMAKKSAEWAEDLKRAAQKIGETTETVQAFDYAAVASGVSIDTERRALESLNDVLGKVQDNLFRGKQSIQLRAFGDLGLSKHDLSNFHTASELLPVIADRIRQVRTAAEQTAVAKALGLEELLPLLKQGGDRVRALTEEARSMGAVVDGVSVQDMAELSDRMKEADMRFDAASKTIGAEFVPALASIKDAAADAMTWVARLLGSLPDGHNSAQWVQYMRQGFTAQAQASALRSGDPMAAFAQGGLGYVLNPQVREGRARELERQASQSFAAAAKLQADRQSEIATAQPPGPSHTLADGQGDGGRGRHASADRGAADIGAAQERYLEALIRAARSLDEAHADRLALIQQRYADAVAKVQAEKGLKPDERQKLIETAALSRDASVREENFAYQRSQSEHSRRVGDELARYREQELQAEAAIAGTLTARQTAERQQLLDEQAQARADLNAKLARDRQSTPAEGLAQLIAQYHAQQAELAAQRKKFATEAADQERSNGLALLRAEAEDLKAQLQMAHDRRARQRIQQEILDNERRQAVIQLQSDQQNGRLTPDAAAARQAAIDTTYAAQTQANRDRNVSPFGKFAQSATDQGLGDMLEQQALTAMQELNAGLAEAIVNGRNLHNVFRQTFHTLEADLLKKGLQTAEGGLFNLLSGGAGGAPGQRVGAAAGPNLGGLMAIATSALKIFGFAEGGRVPGAGNHDSIPALLTPGERVIPKGPSGMFAPLLDQIIAGRMPALFAHGGVVGHVASMAPLRVGAGRGPVHVTTHVHNDLRGVATDAELNNRMALSAERTKAQVLDAVHRSLAGWNAQYQFEYGRP